MPDTVNKQLVYLIYILLGLSVGGYGQTYFEHKDKHNHHEDIQHLHEELHNIKRDIERLKNYVDKVEPVRQR